MAVMLNLDGALLLGLAALVIAIAQRDYPDASVLFRGSFYAAALFFFCSSMHIFGLMPHALAAAYWARIGSDTCLVIVCVNRLHYGRFIPRP